MQNREPEFECLSHRNEKCSSEKDKVLVQTIQDFYFWNTEVGSETININTIYL